MMTAPSEIAAADFIGEDGLIHCGVCGEPKQARVARPKIMGQQLDKTFPIQCACERAATEKAIKEAEERERAAKVDKARADCFPYKSMWADTMENDDGKNPDVTEMCRKYAENFQRFKQAGAGLMFYGPVGTGKTYHAASIANALIDRGERGLFTSLSTLGGRMQADYGNAKAGVLKELTGYDFVVLDDLGIERTTPTMNENAYQIVNALYQSGTVMIFTTNNDARAMQDEKEPDRVRIYSRIFEVCKPVAVTGGDRRRGKARQNAKLFKELLG